MNDKKYVIVALFDIDNETTIFNELIGISPTTTGAFYSMENYDYCKVIRSHYNMTIEEIGKPRKEFGVRNGKLYYEEVRKYSYQIIGETEKGTAKITYSIFEA